MNMRKKVCGAEDLNSQQQQKIIKQKEVSTKTMHSVIVWALEKHSPLWCRVYMAAAMVAMNTRLPQNLPINFHNSAFKKTRPFNMTASFRGPGDKGLKDSIKQNVLHQVPPGQQAPPQLEQQAEDISRGIITALQTDRKALMGGDLLRTIILMSLAIVVMGLFIKKKISATIMIASLILFTGFDLLGVAERYLNSEKFVDESDFESAFIPTEADQQIMKDPDHANFRVFNQTVDAFNDASTSFHHNSVGGYHPAKLDLYNDIITYQLRKGNMEVFDMLNTKYFIVPNPQTGKPMAQLNPGAFGNCWLVSGIK